MSLLENFVIAFSEHGLDAVEAKIEKVQNRAEKLKRNVGNIDLESGSLIAQSNNTQLETINLMMGMYSDFMAMKTTMQKMMSDYFKVGGQAVERESVFVGVPQYEDMVKELEIDVDLRKILNFENPENEANIIYVPAKNEEDKIVKNNPIPDISPILETLCNKILGITEVDTKQSQYASYQYDSHDIEINNIINKTLGMEGLDELMKTSYLAVQETKTPLSTIFPNSISNISEVNNSFNIGEIEINTQATDAKGIANDLNYSLLEEFQEFLHKIDNGVDA